MPRCIGETTRLFGHGPVDDDCQELKAATSVVSLRLATTERLPRGPTLARNCDTFDLSEARAFDQAEALSGWEPGAAFEGDDFEQAGLKARGAPPNSNAHERRRLDPVRSRFASLCLFSSRLTFTGKSLLARRLLAERGRCSRNISFRLRRKALIRSPLPLRAESSWARCRSCLDDTPWAAIQAPPEAVLLPRATGSLGHL